MEIRQLHHEEFEASTELSQYAFQYTLSPSELEEQKKKFKPEQVWGIFEEEELNAKLTLLPLQVYIHGQQFAMGGIAGVATWPEKRRSGMVSRLLKHSLEQMRANGQTVSFLHPFSFPFYRKFGWDIFIEYKKYMIPVDKFPPKMVVEGTIKRNVRDTAELNKMYQEYAKKFNGTLVRDAEWWENRVLDADTQTAVYYAEDGTPEGYVLYKVQKKELSCDEFVYLSKQAHRGLWTYFANHDSMIEKGTFTFIPSNDSLPYLLADPRIQQETIPYFMGRVVDVPAFVQQYPFQSSTQGIEITLALTDTHAPWNDGVWKLSVTSLGEGCLEPLHVSVEEAQLQCDITTLSAMLIGYKRPQELFRWDRITGNAEAAGLLEKVIPSAQTFLMDFF
ncbi:GNAT family N-acetyltransferase [Paenibacillus sp. P96]|uniref:GNAT family N-acetyltransferase n=1 Tax=Paenibacillus zeirhizosphaerae TaxID=2987519 RepID=A0ABT9FMM5_9BACL|nr:GNAT family N-acetyltransferase [Paenibacillus sp. P96]MDP4095986.1 GNAT family N-acetyltransferase [Paenibacillus sp. P96]